MVRSRSGKRLRRCCASEILGQSGIADLVGDRALEIGGIRAVNLRQPVQAILSARVDGELHSACDGSFLRLSGFSLWYTGRRYSQKWGGVFSMCGRRYVFSRVNSVLIILANRPPKRRILSVFFSYCSAIESHCASRGRFRDTFLSFRYTILSPEK